MKSPKTHWKILKLLRKTRTLHYFHGGRGIHGAGDTSLIPAPKCLRGNISPRPCPRGGKIPWKWGRTENPHGDPLWKIPTDIPILVGSFTARTLSVLLSFGIVIFVMELSPKSHQVLCLLLSHMDTVLDNSIWLIGNGERINLWLDNWLGASLVSILNINSDAFSSLSIKLSSVIDAGRWRLPPILLSNLVVAASISNITLPVTPLIDKLVWLHTPDSDCNALFLNKR